MERLAEKKLTRRSDPGYLRAVADKQSYAFDKSSKRG
jgi:hypothetical protein